MPKNAVIESEPTYEVEEIVGYRRVEGKMHFSVKWKGYKYNDNTWEGLDQLQPVWPLLIEYLVQEDMQSLVPEVSRYFGGLDAKKFAEIVEKEDVEEKDKEMETNKEDVIDEKDKKEITKEPKKVDWEKNHIKFVDQVITHRKNQGNIQFYVKWQNSDPSANSWVGLKDLRAEKPLLIEYLENQNLQSLIPQVARFFNDPRSRGLTDKVLKEDLESNLKKNVQKKKKDEVIGKDTKKTVEEDAKENMSKKMKQDENNDGKKKKMAKNERKVMTENVKKEEDVKDDQEKVQVKDQKKDEINVMHKDYAHEKKQEKTVSAEELNKEKKKKENVDETDKKKNLKKPQKKLDPLYLVEGITSHKRTNGQLLFQVRWLGYSERENTFESLDNLLTAKSLVYAYLNRHNLHDLIVEVKRFYGDH